MMTSELPTKLRLVKCPKCRRILLELPDLDVYQCGGCHTTLQAKKRVNAAKSTRSSLHDAEDVQKSKPDHASECKEPSSSSSEDIAPDSGEFSSNQNNGLDHNKSSGSCDYEHLGGVDLSKEHKTNGSDQNDCLNCNIEQSEVSNKVCSSIQVSGDENEELTDNKNEDLADNKNEDLDEHEVNLLADNKNEDFANKENGDSADSKIADLADNKNEDLDDHETEHLADDKNEDFANKENGDSADSDIADLADNKNEDLDDHVIEHLADNKNVDFANEVIGDSADNEIADLADNKNEVLADNEFGDLSDNEHNDELVDNESKDLAHDGDTVLADNENDKFPHNEHDEFSYKENGHFVHNEREPSEVTDIDRIAHDIKEDSADDENEKFEDNENGEFVCNENQEFSRKKNKNFSHNKSEEMCPLPETDSQAAKNDEGSPSTEANMVGFNRNSESNFRSSCTVNLEATMENGSVAFADGPVEHRISSDTCVSSPSEQPEKPQGSVHQVFGCSGSVETSGTIESNRTSNPNGTVRDTLKSSAVISAHAYNGSVSSNDGIDDQLTNSHMHSSRANMVYINGNNDSTLRRSSAVNVQAIVGNDSIVSAERPEEHRISSDTCMSSPSGQLDRPQGSVHQGVGHLRSAETSGTMDFNPSSVLSGTIRDMTNSSAVRSAHAYDGSVSSIDEIDDQPSNHHMHSFQDTCEASHFVPSERSRRDKFLAKRMVNKSSQMPYQASSMFSDRMKHDLKNSKWNQDEFFEPPRHGSEVRKWTRSEREEYQSRLVFPQISSQPGYENGSFSSQLHDEFHRNSGFQPSDLSEDLEHDKMKLMRMIFELQDQLDKTFTLHEMGSDGMPVASRKPRYISKYNNYDASEEEHFRHLNYPRYGRYGARSSYSQQQHRPMHIPFLDEATSSGHQVDPSCLHCRAQDWQHPTQFPPSLPYKNNKRYRIHPGHYSTSYNSCPSSPKHFVDSEYPLRGREVFSDDQRRKSHEIKSYLREKPHLVKRHLRPIAGGAPFVACYKCYKLLQLPADFLLFKRTSHRLRCGACSQVLKFSLFDGSRIVPYTMNSMVPPPSEDGDCSDAIEARNLASTSRANDFLYAEPVSCSDDYGLSHCQSCSTEGDIVPSTFHAHQGSIDGKRMSNGAYDPMRGKKEYRSSLLRYEYAAGPSSSITEVEELSSEIEQPRTSSGSPLHRLMGYSSPSQVIYGSVPSRQKTHPYFMMK